MFISEAIVIVNTSVSTYRHMKLILAKSDWKTVALNCSFAMTAKEIMQYTILMTDPFSRNDNAKSIEPSTPYAVAVTSQCRSR